MSIVSGTRPSDDDSSSLSHLNPKVVTKSRNLLAKFCSSYHLKFFRFKEACFPQLVRGTRPISLQNRTMGLRHSYRPSPSSMFTSDPSRLALCYVCPWQNCWMLITVLAGPAIFWQIKSFTLYCQCDVTCEKRSTEKKLCPSCLSNNIIFSRKAAARLVFLNNSLSSFPRVSTVFTMGKVVMINKFKLVWTLNKYNLHGTFRKGLSIRNAGRVDRVLAPVN